MDSPDPRPVLTSVALGRHDGKGEPLAKGEKPWPHFAYTCTLAYEGRSMDFPYRMGTGCVDAKPTVKWGYDHCANGSASMLAEGLEWRGKPRKLYKLTPRPPSLFDVLYSLCMDAQCYDNARNFEDFCAELGYEEDSRKAEGIYRACGEGAKNLRRVLGSALYAQLVVMDEDTLTAWCNALRGL